MAIKNNWHRLISRSTSFLCTITLLILSQLHLIVSAGPPQTSIPTLSAPFTLVYNMRSSSTKQSADYQKHLIMGQIESQVALGSISRKQADDSLRDLTAQLNQKADPNIQPSVTVSYDGHNTLFLYRRGADTSVMIYDGTRSFCYTERQHRATTEPGLALYMFPAFFYPGMGLPCSPLLTDVSSPQQLNTYTGIRGNAMLIGARGPDFRHPGLFLPAKIKVQKVGQSYKVLDSVLSINNLTLQGSNFTSHEIFEGHWLPRHIVQTTYLVKPLNKVASETDFDLESATTVPLGTDRFEPEYYMKAGLLVQDDDGIPSVAVNYNPSHGSLDKQIAAERNLQQLDAINITKGNPPSHARSGLIALVGVVFIGIAWLIWRRGKSRAV